MNNSPPSGLRGPRARGAAASPRRGAPAPPPRSVRHAVAAGPAVAARTTPPCAGTRHAKHPRRFRRRVASMLRWPVAAGAGHLPRCPATLPPAAGGNKLPPRGTPPSFYVALRRSSPRCPLPWSAHPASMLPRRQQQQQKQRRRYASPSRGGRCPPRCGGRGRPPRRGAEPPPGAAGPRPPHPPPQVGAPAPPNAAAEHHAPLPPRDGWQACASCEPLCESAPSFQVKRPQKRTESAQPNKKPQKNPLSPKCHTKCHKLRPGVSAAAAPFFGRDPIRFMPSKDPQAFTGTRPRTPPTGGGRNRGATPPTLPPPATACGGGGQCAPPGATGHSGPARQPQLGRAM